ncbi:MAG: hypothetical protein AAGI68_03160 [Planctomycetota bacterium]
MIRPRFDPYQRHDPREQMIRETSAFLTWALREERDLPRIPRRRVDRGGFAELLRRSAAARAAVQHWWSRTLGS